MPTFKWSASENALFNRRPYVSVRFAQAPGFYSHEQEQSKLKYQTNKKIFNGKNLGGRSSSPLKWSQSKAIAIKGLTTGSTTKQEKEKFNKAYLFG